MVQSSQKSEAIESEVMALRLTLDQVLAWLDVLLEGSLRAMHPKQADKYLKELYRAAAVLFSTSNPSRTQPLSGRESQQPHRCACRRG